MKFLHARRCLAPCSVWQPISLSLSQLSCRKIFHGSHNIIIIIIKYNSPSQSRSFVCTWTKNDFLFCFYFTANLLNNEVDFFSPSLCLAHFSLTPHFDMNRYEKVPITRFFNPTNLFNLTPSFCVWINFNIFFRLPDSPRDFSALFSSFHWNQTIFFSHFNMKNFN